MRLLIAFIFPWLTFFTIGRPVAGFFCLLTSASASHVLHGDPLVAAGPFMAAPPLLFLAIVMASWALRPPSRRLPDAAVTELSSGR